jgi:cold shock CspA family protein
MKRGVVDEFDEARGIGCVVAQGSDERFEFHCTQIADGTRTIAVGASVEFAVRPWHRGQHEAVDIVLRS